MAAPLNKVGPGAAVLVCARADLSPPALALLTPNLSPQRFLAAMVRDGHQLDAIRFLAHALPAREGVWWACVVAGAATPLTEAEALCLDRAEDWVYEPREAARRRCSAAAETAAFKGAAAYAALAAFWSGGSLAPEGMPMAPPLPELASAGVVASLILALAAGDPSEGANRYFEIMARGVDIASGGNGRRHGDRPRRHAGEIAA